MSKNGVHKRTTITNPLGNGVLQNTTERSTVDIDVFSILCFKNQKLLYSVLFLWLICPINCALLGVMEMFRFKIAKYRVMRTTAHQYENIRLLLGRLISNNSLVESHC
jgi:hypothetical protein